MTSGCRDVCTTESIKRLDQIWSRMTYEPDVLRYQRLLKVHKRCGGENSWIRLSCRCDHYRVRICSPISLQVYGIILDPLVTSLTRFASSKLWQSPFAI